MLALGEQEKAALAKRMREVVAGTSWDRTARRMHELISSAVPGNKAQRMLAPSVPEEMEAGVANSDVTPVKTAQVRVAKSA
jgi:hypothetical protein